MTTNRKRPSGGWVAPETLPKGPNGRALCRWCATEVQPPRQTFCSQACVDEHLVRSNPQHARHLVGRRDHGVCARCGLDTEYLRETARWLWRLASRRWRVTRDAAGHWPRSTDPSNDCGDDRAWRALEHLTNAFLGRRIPATRRDYAPQLVTEHLWEADHIVPVVEGGGECGLDGFRTLCLPCHKRVTAELRRRLAGLRPKPEHTDLQLSMELVA